MKLRIIFLFLAGLASACAPVVKPALDLDAKRQALKLVDQGVVQLRAGELDAASASFRVAYDIEALPQALDGLGAAAYLQGDYNAAENYYIRAYQLDNTYYEAIGNLALLYESQGNKEGAERLYNIAVQKVPTNFRIRNNFGAFLYDKDSSSRAKETARIELIKAKALAAHPLIENNLEQVGDDLAHAADEIKSPAQ